MNGVDAIVFTAGIGENDNLVREDVCSYLGYLGISIDKEVNKNAARKSLSLHRTPKLKLQLSRQTKNLQSAERQLPLYKKDSCDYIRFPRRLTPGRGEFFL